MYLLSLLPGLPLVWPQPCRTSLLPTGEASAAGVCQMGWLSTSTSGGFALSSPETIAFLRLMHQPEPLEANRYQMLLRER